MVLCQDLSQYLICFASSITLDFTIEFALAVENRGFSTFTALICKRAGVSIQGRPTQGDQQNNNP